MISIKSLGDLTRLPKTDPSHPVISTLANNLLTDTDPVTIALMEPSDIGHPLAQLSNAEDVTLEGIIERENTFVIALQTDYGYGIVLVIPDEDWLTSELRQSIELNIYH